MFVLKKYQNHTEFQTNLSNREFMLLQIRIINYIWHGDLIAIKDANLKYIALSNEFIKTFNKKII